MLIDYNVNGAFNDKSIDPGQCDRIRIDDEGGRDTRYVGNFIEVGDKLYKPEIARDGACITLTEATDVVFGAVRVAENITSFGAGGVNGLFLRKPENGIVKLPVGDYRVEHWSIVRNDDEGAKWELRGRCRRRPRGLYRRAGPGEGASDRRADLLRGPVPPERLVLYVQPKPAGSSRRADHADPQRLAARRRPSCGSGAATEPMTGHLSFEYG